MKTSLWVVIVLVSGLVGFLIGYSVSSFTGTRTVQKAAHATGGKAEGQHAGGAAGYGGESGGYSTQKPAGAKATPHGASAKKAPGY